MATSGSSAGCSRCSGRGWGPTVAPRLRCFYDVYSQQHAWHAELLAERLPVLDSLDPATLTVPPDAEVDRALGLLAGTVPGQGDGAGGEAAPRVMAPGRGDASCAWWDWVGWCCRVSWRATTSTCAGCRRWPTPPWAVACAWCGATSSSSGQSCSGS